MTDGASSVLLHHQSVEDVYRHSIGIQTLLLSFYCVRKVLEPFIRATQNAMVRQPIPFIFIAMKTLGNFGDATLGTSFVRHRYFIDRFNFSLPSRSGADGFAFQVFGLFLSGFVAGLTVRCGTVSTPAQFLKFIKGLQCCALSTFFVCYFVDGHAVYASIVNGRARLVRVLIAPVRAVFILARQPGGVYA